MENKKSCMLLLPREIYPTVCGYAIKNKNLIEILSKQYRLTVIVISQRAISSEEENFYKSHTESYINYILPKYKNILGAVKALLGKKPLQVGYYYDKRLQHIIDNIAKNLDILISALIRTREYLSKWEHKGKIIVFDMVDSIGLNYNSSKSKTKSSFWKFIYSIESKRLLNYEKEYIKRSSTTYLFNEKEREYFKRYGRVYCLPHGVDEKLFEYNKTDDRYKSSVVFMGKMDYQPNIDAAMWYMENVHTRIGDKIPLIIVGAYPSDEILKLAKKLGNATVTGYVDDPYIYAKSALLLVAPMQTGGGIQNKILEGMALGKINIISSLSAAAITAAIDKRDFIIADTPDEYITAITDIKENKESYKQIEINARELIKNNYTWQSYAKGYIEHIEELLIPITDNGV